MAPTGPAEERPRNGEPPRRAADSVAKRLSCVTCNRSYAFPDECPLFAASSQKGPPAEWWFMRGDALLNYSCAACGDESLERAHVSLLDAACMALNHMEAGDGALKGADMHPATQDGPERSKAGSASIVHFPLQAICDTIRTYEDLLWAPPATSMYPKVPPVCSSLHDGQAPPALR